MLTAHFPDVAAAIAGLDDEVVLDGELVIWNAGRFDFAALQDRLRSGPRRAHALAAATPAAYVVFDLLAHGRTDLREQPYQHRRDALETLLRTRPARGAGAHPVDHRPGRRPQLAERPRQLRDRGCGRETPRPALPPGRAGLAETAHPAHRRSGRRRRHRPARRAAGAAAGPPRPRRAACISSGAPPSSTPAGRDAVAALLRPHTGSGHPWPNPLPSTRWGRPGPPTVYTPVRPRVVVELTVDTAVEHHRWRHPAHFVRVRPDLRINDLTPLLERRTGRQSSAAAAG